MFFVSAQTEHGRNRFRILRFRLLTNQFIGGRHSSLERILSGINLVVFPRMKLKSSVRSLDLLPQPLKLALSLVLSSSFNHP